MNFRQLILILFLTLIFYVTYITFFKNNLNLKKGFLTLNSTIKDLIKNRILNKEYIVKLSNGTTKIFFLFNFKSLNKEFFIIDNLSCIEK